MVYQNCPKTGCTRQMFHPPLVINLGVAPPMGKSNGGDPTCEIPSALHVLRPRGAVLHVANAFTPSALARLPCQHWKAHGSCRRCRRAWTHPVPPASNNNVTITDANFKQYDGQTNQLARHYESSCLATRKGGRPHHTGTEYWRRQGRGQDTKNFYSILSRVSTLVASP